MCLYFNGFWWWPLWIIHLDYIIFFTKIYVSRIVYTYLWSNLWVVCASGFDREEKRRLCSIPTDLSKNVTEISFISDDLLRGCNLYSEETRKRLSVSNRISIFLSSVMVNSPNIACPWMSIALAACSVRSIWKVNFPAS